MTRTEHHGGRARRVAWRVMLGFGVLVVVLSGWVTIRAMLALEEASALREAAARFEQTLDDADLSESSLRRVSGGAGALAGHAQALAGLTGDPVWRLAELIPGVGTQLHAARAGAEELARVAESGEHVLAALVAAPVLAAAPPAAGAGASTRSAPEGDAGEQIVALRALRPSLRDMVVALDGARARLGGIDRTALIPQLTEALGVLDQAIERAAPPLEALHRVAEVAPSILGADETRHILVMLQNPAELRAAGGVTGTFIAFRADRGALTLAGQADSSDFPILSTPLTPIPEDASVHVEDGIGRFVQNASSTPDFGLTARLAVAWWHGHAGVMADAVVSIDPLVLELLLRVTGPVVVDGRAIAAEQVVDELVRRPYFTMGRDEQTAFFESAVEATFTAALENADLAQLALDIAPLVDAGRISVWSAHPAEQDVIGDTALAGMAARMAQGDTYAVLFDNLSGGKLDTYLDASFDFEVSRCRPDGRITIDLSVTLTNTFPAGLELPWTEFPGLGGFASDEIGLRVTTLGLPDATAESVRVDGAPVSWTPVTVVGRPGAATAVGVPPGRTVVVDYRLVDGTEPSGFVHTPLVGTAPVTLTEGGCG